jgi:hypothetical protein
MTKIPKQPKKYVGWGGIFERRRTKLIIIVSAKSRKKAVDILKHFDFTVVSETHIRHVCLVQYPGPKAVQELKTKNWNDSTEIVKEKDDGVLS